MVYGLDCYRCMGGSSQFIVGTDDFSNLFNNQIILDWSNYPGAGNYTLIAQTVVLDGKVKESQRINVTIK